MGDIFADNCLLIQYLDRHGIPGKSIGPGQPEADSLKNKVMELHWQVIKARVFKLIKAKN